MSDQGDQGRLVCRRCGWDSDAPDGEGNTSPFCSHQGHLLVARRDLKSADATPRTEHGPLETAERASRTR